jgi:hypothetical protein
MNVLLKNIAVTENIAAVSIVYRFAALTFTHLRELSTREKDLLTIIIVLE